MTQGRRWRGGAALGMLLLLAGCGSARTGTGTYPVTPVGDTWYSLDDQRLAQGIRESLLADHELDGLTSGIGIDAHSGMVRLHGEVPTAAAKAEAGVCARWLAGTDAVENDLAVRSP